ncbi:MAG: LysM peptidoglycan-binding domain-containing protein [Streptococcaceae bacterium]|jgi:LysM repeat protein|nr:LysM peptidoglycan-binding domain-containing protein [Streptococcaceae bacterium]
MENLRVNRYRAKMKPKKSLLIFIILWTIILVLFIAFYVASDAFKTFYYVQQKVTKVEKVKMANDNQISNDSAVASPTSETPSTYSVQSGDTASSIAEAYGLTLEALYALNPTVWNSDGSFVNGTLSVGEVLTVSGSVSEKAEASPADNNNTGVYAVQAGDSAGLIAEKNGISLEELYALNPEIWASDGSYVNGAIAAGQMIKVN